MSQSSLQQTAVIDRSALDPHTRKFLEAVDAAGLKPIYELPPDVARIQHKQGRAPLLSDPVHVDSATTIEIDGPVGKIPLRIYRPAGLEDSAPVLLYFHGGGWTLGDIDTYDPVCRLLAVQTPCAVVSVDYRLAPEYPFPIAIDECMCSLRYIANQASSLGFDRNRIAVGGDSAGANLAAVVCLLARDQQEPEIDFQLLIYPATDQRTESPSHYKYANGFLLTRKSIHYFRNNYLRPEDYLNWRASPLLAGNFKDLPDAFIATAGFDPLLDEGIQYATLLRDAKVGVRYHCFEDQIHGFINLGKVIPAAELAIQHFANELNRHFTRSNSD